MSWQISRFAFYPLSQPAIVRLMYLHVDLISMGLPITRTSGFPSLLLSLSLLYVNTEERVSTNEMKERNGVPAAKGGRKWLN